MNSRIPSLDDFINEGTKRTYEEFLEEFTDIFLSRSKDKNKAADAIDYFHNKGYIEDYWTNGDSPKTAVNFLIKQKYYK